MEGRYKIKSIQSRAYSLVMFTTSKPFKSSGTFKSNTFLFKSKLFCPLDSNVVLPLQTKRAAHLNLPLHSVTANGIFIIAPVQMSNLGEALW